MSVGSESNTDSIASVPLGEMTVLEPLQEPEPEVETEQFGSPVQGFELIWDTRWPCCATIGESIAESGGKWL